MLGEVVVEESVHEVSVRSAPLIVVLALLELALPVGCKGRPSPLETAPSRAESTAVAPRPAPPDHCGGRARCSTSRQPIDSAPGVALVTVRAPHALDAGTDEERCDRREYWLSRPSGDLLVAVDCERQWGAGNAGPATIKVQGKRLLVSYTELQSSDRCEAYSASVGVAGPRLVESQSRVTGTVVKDVCRPGKEPAPVVPVGDGSAAYPLLTLHR